ncbi:CDP-glycerol glycerophosphotransferase family protein [Rhizobium sp. ARZ01]|uniref:CDP-glycerol glycerophosphotransferase family protein n=1 Tax=Rhizobium sp. ARZ01 TaxID=2769313 RepID=UPI00177C23AE|nr:CDP-glycerol glycerophosphotransferase family protein [Rhizobium sp. ARZ01]MBD9373209.1 CDP-glycerol glycerophosphotransferase family protein [Rhizobium sp. ARZ01]
MSNRKVAFVVKNKFQIAQFHNLAVSYPEAVYLLMDRKTLWSEFRREDILGSSMPVRLVNRANVDTVSSEFDVIFFQTLFAGIEKVRTPLVSVQYGLAKERHNYGEWRALADLNLMYGDYSVRQVQHFSTSAAVGNLKFAGWDPDLDRNDAKGLLGLDNGRPVVLYMPTYGELGTFDELVEPLGRLVGEFNILIKMHHNNEMRGADWVATARSHGIAHCFHGGADQRALLSAADVVISDYSGAIFDAVYARVPVVLYQPDTESRRGAQKFDLTSLEFRRRNELGLVFERAEDLRATLHNALKQSVELVERAEPIRAELFVDSATVDPIGRSHSLVEDLLSGRIPPLTTQQLYVRDAVRRLLAAEARLQAIERHSLLGKLRRIMS